MCQFCAAAAGAGDGYEYSEPITISAQTTAPKLPSPYNTDCEYSVHAISFTDAGSIAVSSTPFPPTITNTYTTAGSEYGYGGRVYQTTTAGFYPMPTAWSKLSGNFLYFQFNMTGSHSAHVTIVFRRRRPATPLIPHMDGAEYSAEQTGNHGRPIGGASFDNGRGRQQIDQYIDPSRGARTR